MSDRATNTGDIRRRLRATVEQMGHILPAQAPIRDFVHHNTLHGFQHLPFVEAVAKARRFTGNRGFLPPERFRAIHASGRITDSDLLQVVDEAVDLDASETVLETADGPIKRRDIYLRVLLHALKPITGCQLRWQIDELDVLHRFQPDVTRASRTRLLSAAARHGQLSEASAISGLWSACLDVLGLTCHILHPDEMLDLSADQAERILQVMHQKTDAAEPVTQRQMRIDAAQQLLALMERVGPELTLRGLLLELTGRDLLDDIGPMLIRQLGGFLDQGLAAWHPKDREQGFYRCWRLGAHGDLTYLFEDLHAWTQELAPLPEDSLETVISELKRLGLDRTHWPSYLERLAQEIPGWSGMFLWRHQHPGYQDQRQPVSMMDYLAVRLVLERIFAQRLCRQQWHLEPGLDMLRWYLRRNPAEFLVRHALFAGRLPEYLSSRAQRALTCSDFEQGDQGWEQVAELIWAWQHNPTSDHPDGFTVFRSAWPLFRLAQHLGVCSEDLRRAGRGGADVLFDCISRLGNASASALPAKTGADGSPTAGDEVDRAGYLRLQAYERHYRDELFQAVQANHGRGRWHTRDRRPDAQVIFCMDDREEGARRHLEAINPEIETMGAAGFFGIEISWRGIDDTTTTPLCPVVVTPSHEILEEPLPEAAAAKRRHDLRRALRLRLSDLLHQEVRRNLLSSAAVLALAAPAALITLVGRLFAPLSTARALNHAAVAFDGTVPTLVAIDALDPAAVATPEHPRLGFTDEEQAERVAGFLRTIGLTDGLGRLVVLMGHGSTSQNNPHRAAYDCGACSGHHGGPNARVFAAMANRPAVRALLTTAHGIGISPDTWFVGAQRNTCNDVAEWYDLDSVPTPFRPMLGKLQDEIDQANTLHAAERCRRFASAPSDPPPRRGHAHVLGRAEDVSQARPELGHATNAAAFIGRRALSRGAFFDRRVFLISYDPTRDPDGSIVESILLAASPVGAGINLEYYFSTVDNEHYGCGSKVTHNVTGLFGVMDGTTSDLRTGLPWQMIEIHEAMRLQVLVEARTEILTAIYLRQPSLQELVGNGWLLLSAKDPDSPRIDCFDPQSGWGRWTGGGAPLPEVEHSQDWYRGHRGLLPPALVTRGV